MAATAFQGEMETMEEKRKLKLGLKGRTVSKRFLDWT